MSDPYTGEIRILAIPNGRPPADWLLCDGGTLSINSYPELYSLIGTTYGGNGVTTFALPDLRGRLPVGQGNGPGLTPRVAGQMFGTEVVALNAATTPPHTHTFNTANTPATTAAISTNVSFANTTSPTVAYLKDGLGTPGGTVVALNTVSVSSAGSGMGHANIMPCATMNFIICARGMYPSRAN